MKATRIIHNQLSFFTNKSHALGINTKATSSGERFCVYLSPQQINQSFDEIRFVGRIYSPDQNKARFQTIATATNTPQEITNGRQEIESIVSQDELVPYGQAA